MTNSFPTRRSSGLISVGPITTEVNGEPRLFARQAPDARFASTFDHGMATSLLAAGELPDTTRVEDPTGLASGALLYRVELAPGESREVDLLAPLIGDMPFTATDWSRSDARLGGNECVSTCRSRWTP